LVGRQIGLTQEGPGNCGDFLVGLGGEFFGEMGRNSYKKDKEGFPLK